MTTGAHSLVRLATVVLVAGCGRGDSNGKRNQSQWDGRKPLTCGTGDLISLVDCRSELPGQVAISAGNGCKITLERCAITAETAISAANGVTIRMIDTTLVGSKQGLALWNSATADVQGGRIEGTEAAIYAVNHVRIALSRTTVVGPVQRMNDSEITGLPELDPEQAAEKIANAFGQKVCDLAVACYGAGYLGVLAGRFTVELDASGKVNTATFDGEAPAAARACLTTASTKQIEGFSGPPGRLQCAYSGQVGPTSFEFDRAWSFVPL